MPSNVLRASRMRFRACAALLALAASGCFPPGDAVGLDETEIVLSVLDQADQGVGGAEVRWWPAGLEGIALNEAGTTGTSGRVTFDTGIWHEITIELVLPAGYTPAASQENPFTITAKANSRTNVTFRASRP